MKILEVASEAAPFAKTGGLADVIGSLPRALAQAGHEVRVLMPRYRSIRLDQHPTRRTDGLGHVTIGGQAHPVIIDSFRERRYGLEFCFLVNEAFYGRTGLYVDPSTGKDFIDNDDCFAFLARAALEMVRAGGWRPDVIHVHDWQAGLVAPYAKLVYKDDPVVGSIRTVLTIHNLAYQGSFDAARFGRLGFPADRFFPASPFEFYNKVNFLKAAICYADKITTVSERYAQEIQTEEFGSGLFGVLAERSGDLTGILNGVDYSIWSPSRDKKIPFTYYLANLSGKRMNKVELLNRAGLPIRDNDPLVGMITRLADQKGLDLIEKVADDLFGLDLQMIILGTGDSRYHELFNRLQEKYPDKLRVYLDFDESLAHQIEAGADLFLMPSQFEPCGLNQMYSLRYGTVPIVREVGGLADTVIDFNQANGSGTGFVFKPYDARVLLETVRRAIAVFRKKRVWTKLMKAGMKQDFSWDRSASRYITLFTELTQKH